MASKISALTFGMTHVFDGHRQHIKGFVLQRLICVVLSVFAEEQIKCVFDDNSEIIQR